MAKIDVAPLAGAWIEIAMAAVCIASAAVAPLAGAWIEITIVPRFCMSAIKSLPSRERGLK